MTASAELAYEQWRKVAGYEGLYQVSSEGRLRRLTFRNGTTNQLYQIPRPLRAQVSRRGYLRIALWKNGERQQSFIHQLVLGAFVGPCPKQKEGGHLDGNRLNNNISNLAWVTSKENSQHMQVHGTQRRGEKCTQAKLTDQTALEVLCRIERGEGIAQLAEEFGVNDATLYHLKSGVNWKHVRPLARSILQKEVLADD